MKSITNRGRKILSRVFRVISVSAASLILQACYGMPPPEEQELSISAKVMSKETREPIFGIKVSIEGTKYWDYTNKNGYINILVPLQDDYILKFEDVDGPYNGGLFKEQTRMLKKSDANNTLLIHMDLDTETDEE